ncbi:hypothetical protein LEP1GSC043_2415 [Leptospira weilii str. Ecochallenge]|uniref:Uncharacterized protein n=1 Tax=Leptospira weilii str. Ecochallenge TaxID=1049986 RepID=N1U2I2_9LEPT|nr:hypothetical protein LEP1GSC043_2415 [Leptospira weilii str. Ecochallenge]
MRTALLLQNRTFIFKCYFIRPSSTANSKSRNSYFLENSFSFSTAELMLFI